MGSGIGGAVAIIMMFTRTLVISYLTAVCLGDTHVLNLGVEQMRELLTERDKVIVLIHLTATCRRTEEFAPTLDAIAKQITTLVGRIDVKMEPSSAWCEAFKRGLPVDAASGIMPNAPVLKAFLRNPGGWHVQRYRGPPTLEAVSDWAHFIDSWDGPMDVLAERLEAASTQQQAEQDDATRQESAAAQRRYAGREGAFNGPSVAEAYQHMMGANAYQQAMGSYATTRSRHAQAAGAPAVVADDVKVSKDEI